MTLTVDEVRNIRFPMVRQPNEDGYRASAVDNFIDRLEVSYATIVDENEQLKANLAKADTGADAAFKAAQERLSAEIARLQAENNELRSGAKGDAGSDQALRAAQDELLAVRAELQTKLAQANAEKVAALAAAEAAKAAAGASESTGQA
ncbi:MAG: DivIVA domain-containing protein, partial [Propionibacteriaceae bacterium]|nr:DivIVA domain-containing protein [Propionibacteriaceae bacterium]